MRVNCGTRIRLLRAKKDQT